ncbi:MAG: diacylglycerol kinase family lipid kinase [Phycisphaeraceae bacterium]|nr:diacylglycerol kinase family lipid kinase [Phycisphaeraceae bacterium]
MPCLIYNPYAGSAPDDEQQLQMAAEEAGCEWVRSEQPGDLPELARRLEDEGQDRIVIGGGDGTIASVISALKSPRPEIGILPLGTANDLARSLGLSGSIDELLRRAVVGPVTPIDLVTVEDGDRSCVVNAVAGGCFGSPEGQADPPSKQWLGELAYRLAALRRIGALTEHQLTIGADDREVSLSTWGLAAANGRFAGGGFMLGPEAMINDGRLDITVVPSGDWLETTTAAFDVLFQRQAGSDRVVTFRARRLEVDIDPPMGFSFDGEPTEVDRMVLEVQPQALSVVAGPYSPALGDAEP